MTMIERAEIEQARQMFAEAIFSVEAEGRNVQLFATAALLAASELYSEVWSGADLSRAFSVLERKQQLAAGTAGQA